MQRNNDYDLVNLISETVTLYKFQDE